MIHEFRVSKKEKLGILYVMDYGIYIYSNGIIGIDNWILSRDLIYNGLYIMDY